MHLLAVGMLMPSPPDSKIHSSAHSLQDIGNCDGAAFVTSAAECAVAAQSLDLLAVDAGPRPAQLPTNPFGCCENTPLNSP